MSREVGNLINLLKLNVKGNPLIELPKELENLKNLENLYIDGSFSINQYCKDDNNNEISHRNILTLDMSNKNITDIPYDIFLLYNLEELNISDNELTQITPFIFKLKKLKKIDMQKNKLERLPELIWSLSTLKEIILDSYLLIQLKDLKNRKKEITSFPTITIKPIITHETIIKLIIVTRQKQPMNNYDINRLFDVCHLFLVH